MSKYIKPPKSEDCIWRSGPPPSVGWWPASANNPPNPQNLRYWNGSFWSIAVRDAETSADALKWSELETTLHIFSIKWTDRWWPNNQWAIKETKP